ncbi:MAG TPA: endonuclease/exonuclease/phosphatase family protein [Thermoanaerobaculia bacterium]|nr:endonuclease/exonuclease/phosphatase family protein [Thermoanaerobaculia bacterium]
MKLKVMTYNIRGDAAARRPDHIPKIAETIAAIQPDLVALQEVHCRNRFSARADQAAQIAGLTGLNVHFGRSCEMEGGDYGNAVLTRGSIESARVHPLPGSGEPRSLLETGVRIDGAEIAFFVTHLAAWGRLLRRARLEQIAVLGDIIGRATMPHLLAGDFNVPPPAGEMRTLLGHGHLRLCGDAREATFPLTRQRLDYIFGGPGWEVIDSEVVRRGPSDHWPVTATLALREA